MLDAIDLAITPGTKLGIIGPNGAGKSTLLKVMCGILEPTHGTVETHGRIAPLLELGAGFDTNLSVQQNVLLYGTLLGFSRSDLLARLDRILDFAELAEYAAYPVRALSSGMTARLGFAVATDVAPEILIVDEVLSVGDQRFREKSKQRLDDLWHADTTVLTVSHELDFVRTTCERVIWLDRGSVRFDGDPTTAVSGYITSVDLAANDLVRSMKQRYLTESGSSA